MIEEKTAEAVLEKAQTLNIGGEEYTFAPPNLATLIEVSRIVGRFPIVEKGNGNALYAAIANAEAYEDLGECLAVLLLGARRPEWMEGGMIRRWWRRITGAGHEAKTKRLAQIIMHTMPPSNILQLLTERLAQMEVGVFFGITTSLSEINILRPTKEVEKKESRETTACGQQS